MSNSVFRVMEKRNKKINFKITCTTFQNTLNVILKDYEYKYEQKK